MTALTGVLILAVILLERRKPEQRISTSEWRKRMRKLNLGVK